MEKMNTRMVNCLLCIDDPLKNFTSKLQVELKASKLEEGSISSKDIIDGLSEKVFTKNVDKLKSDTCRVYLYRPEEINKEDLLNCWESKDVQKITDGIKEMLSGLSEDAKQQILNRISQTDK